MILPFSSRKNAKLLVQTLLLLAVGTQLSSAKVFTYRYFRFHPTKLRSSTDNVQLSEFRFFNGTTPLTVATVYEPTNNSPAAEAPPFAFDNNLNTKWLNRGFANAYLTFDFGSPVAIDRYNFSTANDFSSRDPISWTIEASSDGQAWFLLDAVTGFATTETRYAAASPSNFVLPDYPKAVIDVFDIAQAQIIDNGGGVDFYVRTFYANSAVITSDLPGSTPVQVTSPETDFISVLPPANRDTIYTLVATTPGGNVTKSLPVRSVNRQTQNFRYVRYTPIKLRGNVGATQTIGLSDFKFRLNDTQVPVVSVTNPGGVFVAGQGPENLIDTENGTATKWVSTNLSPVVFDFGGAGGQFNSYSFSTALDGIERDPTQWVLEGSNNGTTWTLFENMTTFDHLTTPLRNTPSFDIPIGGSPAPYSSLSSDATFVTSGTPITLTYSSLGATNVSITPSVATTGLSGSVTFVPAQTTTYQLTATNAAGKTSTRSVNVVVIPVSGIINYPNFETAPEIALLGSAQILNDFATFSTSPNSKRLRLTGLLPNQSGTAWSLSKVKVSDGFQTTFDTHIAFPEYVNGADGIAFTIQDNAAKYNATPSTELQLSNRSVSIVLDSFPDKTDETQANLEIYVGTTRFANFNLDKNGAKVAKGYQGTYLVTQPIDAPYRVRITYTPGALSVYVDDILVADKLAINLASVGAADAEGKSYLGFSGKTRSIIAYHDVVNWVFTPGAPVVSAVLALTNSSFTFGNTPQVVLTFKSTIGKTYRVTRSSNLVNWTAIGENVTAVGTSTIVTRPFTAENKGFFRVETVN